MRKQRLNIKIFLLIILMVSCFSIGALESNSGMFVNSPLNVESEAATYLSQLGLQSLEPSIPSEPVLQAIGNAAYPVTPGDVYILSYSDGNKMVSFSLQADGDCNISIPSIGKISGKGMTYADFKAYVETLIDTYYPYSSPQLVLTGCGLFSVRISGEVSYASYVNAWGLSRLSDFAVYASLYASTRSIIVKNANGQETVYDLYDGLKNNAAEQNPLVKPGDDIVFVPAEKTVSINGAVKKGGTYQVLDGETLEDLLNSYADGFLKNADTSSIFVSSFQNGKQEVKTIESSEMADCALSDGDSISVSVAFGAMPFVTIQGAVSNPASSLTVAEANRVFYSFKPGETINQMIRSIAPLLLPESDLNGFYLIREGQRISINAFEILANSDNGTDVLKAGDVFVIPFAQQYVTVNGAVNKPGNYPYIPDKGAEYYINLAGGFSDGAKKSHKITMTDPQGEKIKNETVVQPEWILTAEKDMFKTNLATTTAVIGLAASLVSITLNIIYIVANAKTI